MASSDSTTAAPAAAAPPSRRQVIAGVVGMMLEMYDWQVYGFTVAYISASLFDPSDPFSGLLNGLLVFAVGFLMRPLGGAIIGAYTDRFGRRAGMILGLVLVGVGSLMIAAVPGYAQIGTWAGVILVAARVLQGIGVGGEQGAAVSYLSEIAPPGKRALYNAFGYVASSVAVVLAIGLTATLPTVLGEDAMNTWGWRIPFVIGAVFTLYAIVMRRTMAETAQFTETKQSHAGARRHSSTRILLTKYPKPTLLTFLFVGGGTFCYYVFVLQYSTFAHMVTGIKLSQAQLLTTIVIVVFAILQPIFGSLADRFGRKRVLLASAIGMFVTLWPGLLLVTGNPAVIIGLQLLATLPAAAAASVGNAAIAELFPTEVRAVGVALPYAVSVALFGGTAPYIMALFAGRGQVVLLALYGTLLLAFTLVATLLMPERSRVSLSSVSEAPR
ncbi:MFS transporter [Nonomuraea sp. NBC_01738]|uniref:MFS transporter n=1 Tax=Nonomuraea sp. NBC_01738 TaxID=2976003 RepID=UPI002E12993F|nr:MFS transporter [Nonomuraea sp. NBC_01738]